MRRGKPLATLKVAQYEISLYKDSVLIEDDYNSIDVPQTVMDKIVTCYQEIRNPQ